MLNKVFKGKKINSQEKRNRDSLISKNRVVRFFISSTFRDMQEERDVLIKKVFPQLQQQFRWRGVEIIAIDLRWGVTREQAENGAVIPLCFAEIDQCQPYFIGLLGDRYGWIPDTLPPELLKAYPWLAEYRDRSLTELEIIHGVLNDPKSKDHAFFFLRKPDYLRWESGAPKKNMDEESPEKKVKLQALKDRIWDSNCDFEEYRDPEELVMSAYQILEMALDEEFPEQKLEDPFAQEAQAHQIHAQPFETVHVPRQTLIKQLDDYIQQGGPPLVVLGDTGSGKTALISNYYRCLKETHPNDFILLHFVGILQQNSIAGLIYRITGELQRHFSLKGVLLRTDKLAISAFPRWLEETSSKGKVILLIDDVDQLGYRGKDQDFSWLPSSLPGNIRLIFTAKPDNTSQVILSRTHNLIQLPPLEKDEREQIIIKHFKIYGKNLEQRYISALAATPQAALPLFLTILLNELRIFGYFEELSEHITHYLTSQHLLDLYHKVLGRFEKDFCGNGPDIVKDFISLLYHSRHGLSENDLKYSLKVEKVDELYNWYSLMSAAIGIMKARNGRLFIGDKFLENTIWERYIKNTDKPEHYHKLLVDCFTQQQMTASDMSELFWHLFNLQDWQQLHDILADLDFIRSEIRSHVLFNEIMGYWLILEKQSPFRMKTTYKEVLKNPKKDPELYDFVAALQKDPALLKVGIDFVGELIKQPEPLFRNKYDPDPGIFFEKSKDGTATVEAIGSAKHKFEDPLLKQMSEHSALGMQALNLYNNGDVKGAMDTAKLQEQLCRKRSDKINLITSLTFQSSILRKQSELDTALDLLQETEQLCLEIKDRSNLSIAYGEQGIIFLAQNQLDKAMPLFQEQEKICRELDKEISLQEAIRNQGLVFLARNALDDALKLFQEQEQISRKISFKPGLRFSLEKQAEIEFARQRWQEALTLFRQLEEICLEIADQAGSQHALGRQGFILFNSGNVDAAFSLWSTQEIILRGLNDSGNMQIVLGNLGSVWETKKNFPEAIKKYKEQENICRKHNILQGLQFSLDKQAAIFHATKQYDKAAELWQEQEKICRELKDMVRVQWAIGNQGRAYFDKGNPFDALPYFKKQERICREIKLEDPLSISLFNQAISFDTLNKYDKSLPLLNEALRLFSRINNTEMQKRAAQVIDIIQKKVDKERSDSI